VANAFFDATNAQILFDATNARIIYFIRELVANVFFDATNHFLMLQMHESFLMPRMHE